MLKKRTESKKKKPSLNNSKNQKPLLINHTDKILLKLAGGYCAKPCIYGVTPLDKTPKSSCTATPTSKIRKQQK
jgi:hypothetical protein